MRAAMEDLFSAWSRNRNRICRMRPEPEKEMKKADSGRIRLRSRGIKVGYGQAAREFSIDTLWRPSRYIQNDFQTANDHIVTDRSTGLTWQRAGSAYPITWTQARAYISHLNETGFHGRGSWRLPTVEELLSLLTQTPHGTDFCIEPVFDQTRKWIWSADRCSYTSAWYANAEMGFVGRQDMSALFYARGVCDAPVDG
jgi:serine/threonine-protein kinase